MRKYYIGITILSILVGLVIIGGIIQTGGPFSAKNIKLDEERLNNFNEISSEIRSIYKKTKKLPPDLANVEDNKISVKKLKINDPETGEVYEYKIISSTDYNLCTNFSTDSKEISEKYEDYYFYDSYRNKMKNHKKGKDCITYSVISSSNDEYDEYYDEYDDAIYEEDEIDYIDESTITPTINNARIYNCSNFKLAPLPIGVSGSLKGIDISSSWINPEGGGLNICLTRAYLTPVLEDMDEKNRSFINPSNKHYLSLEFMTRNTGVDSVHLMGTEFLRLDSNGKLSSPIAGNQYSVSPQEDLTFNSVFLVEPSVNNFKVLFGDLVKPNTVNLNFSNAKILDGKLYWERGFESN